MSEPTVAFKKSRPKTASRLKLQHSYRDEDDESAQEDASSSIVRPKKVTSQLASRSTFKSALSRSRQTESAASSALVSEDEASRPAARSIYSSDYLSDLQKSTPRTPDEFRVDSGTTLSMAIDAADVHSSAILDAYGIEQLMRQREKPADTPDGFIAVDNHVNRLQSCIRAGDADASYDDEGQSCILFGAAEASVHDRLRKTQIEDALDTLQDTVDVDQRKSAKPAITFLSGSDASSSDEDDAAWEATQIKKATIHRISDLAGLSTPNGPALLTGDEPSMSSSGLLQNTNAAGVRVFQGPPVPTFTPLATFPQMLSAMQAKLAQTRTRLQTQEQQLTELEQEAAGIREEEAIIKGKLGQASVDYQRLRLEVGGLDAMHM
ncbi:nineteen complex-related protein 2-domain-containing protein [Protomyces lactucae-debilis]|uniref:Nineteen complex-related protein 2-domain-containing protein n=1 Tax=Protomyces lactucae-debilis TaxID=2754530 RepID=A0A1Y2F125_PROLT|nr:nineteen complex-related protein 2-domain-containing protein [Protomyces lactucae-debilis]ORY76665.1 nineteen complex-related protein 2-domain-containing protein [Protomyces lactucae-debilis]